MPSPEAYSTERPLASEHLLSFMRICAKEARQTVGELLRSEEIDDQAADNRLATLAILTSDTEIARTIYDDGTKAVAIAAIGRQTHDDELIEEAFETVERITDVVKQQEALKGTVIALGDVAATDLISDAGLRRKAVTEIVEQSKDPALVKLVSPLDRLRLIDKMVHSTGDLRWFMGIEDNSVRDNRLADYGLRKHNRAAIDLISDPYKRISKLIEVWGRQFVGESDEHQIMLNELRHAISGIADPSGRADLYISYMQQFGDTTPLLELRQAAAELEGGMAVRAESFVARFAADGDLAKGLLERLDEVDDFDRDLVLGNLARASLDFGVADQIINVDERNRIQTEILVTIGDGRLAMRRNNFYAASAIATNTLDVELACQIGARWAGKSMVWNAYGPLLSIAILQQTIEPLLRPADQVVQNTLITQYVEETGDVSEVIFLKNPDLDKKVMRILERQADGLSLDDIANIDDINLRLQYYRAYDLEQEPSAETRQEIAEKALEIIRTQKQEGTRYVELELFAPLTNEIPVLKEAAYDSLYIADKKRRVEVIIRLLQALRRASEKQPAH